MTSDEHNIDKLVNSLDMPEIHGAVESIAKYRPEDMYSAISTLIKNLDSDDEMVVGASLELLHLLTESSSEEVSPYTDKLEGFLFHDPNEIRLAATVVFR